MEGLSASACGEVCGSSEISQAREALAMEFQEVPALWATLALLPCRVIQQESQFLYAVQSLNPKLKLIIVFFKCFKYHHIKDDQINKEEMAS